MRKGVVSRTTQPKGRVSIEYDTEDYIMVSSSYPHKLLKRDIEDIKVPIKITITYG